MVNATSKVVAALWLTIAVGTPHLASATGGALSVTDRERPW